MLPVKHIRVTNELVIGFVCLLLVGVSGCKSDRKKESKDESPVNGASALGVSSGAQPAASTGTQLPQLLAQADPNAAGVALELDDKTGRPKPTLVLRLDYFPEPKPGATNLPACFSPFAADFSLGVVVCQDNPTLQQTVFAKNVDQDCYTDSNDQRTTTVQPILLLGCKKAQLVMHQYAPTLRIDLETR